MTQYNTNVISTWESNHFTVNGRQLMAKEQIGTCWTLWIPTTHIIVRLFFESWHENIHDKQVLDKTKEGRGWVNPSWIKASEVSRAADELCHPWDGICLVALRLCIDSWSSGSPVRVHLPVVAEQSSGRYSRFLSHSTIRDRGVSSKSSDFREKLWNGNWKASTHKCPWKFFYFHLDKAAG